MEKTNQAQQLRLAFIDFSLQYFGLIARADLLNRFAIGLAAATRDFSAYRTLAPDNLVLIQKSKQYQRTEHFQPLFEHDAQALLSGLSSGINGALPIPEKLLDRCCDAIRLIKPNNELIATLMRSIVLGQKIECHYVSLSSGESKRILVAHSLVNNSHRWHLRAFDEKNNQFRDFVCTRFTKVKIIDSQLDDSSLAKHDKQWQRIVDLTLIPHPNIHYKKAIELDYAMSDGQLKLEVRAALVGYLLQQWQVDCSAQSTLTSPAHQLALKNINTLYGVDNLFLAPGYQEVGDV